MIERAGQVSRFEASVLTHRNAMTTSGIRHSCPVASPSSENRSAALPSFGSIVRNPTVSPPTMAKKITPSTLRIAFRVVIGACTSCRETLSKQVAVAFRSHETCVHSREKACAFARKSAVAIPSTSRGRERFSMVRHGILMFHFVCSIMLVLEANPPCCCDQTHRLHSVL